MIDETGLEIPPPPEPRGPGFYKNVNGELLYAPHFVVSKDYELWADKDKLAASVDGWEWFETEAEAQANPQFTITCEDGTVLNV